MNPIQSLQHMLNHMARIIPTLPRIAETGQFDEDTLEAVMIFQRDSRLPVTGIVDQLTWNAITSAYYLNLFQTGTPPSLSVFPFGTTVVRETEYAPIIFVVQAMMSALSDKISNFEKNELNGVNNGGTAKNIRILQSLFSLPENATLDRPTWTVLSHLYRALVTRRSIDTSHL